KIAPGTGACEVRSHVLPPSRERAKLGRTSALAKSPPPTTPCRPSRKATVNVPAVPVPPAMGVEYEAHLSPPSLVTKIRELVVTIHARVSPCVATQVPLAANAPSSVCAGGSRMLFHVLPSVVRIAGNCPVTFLPSAMVMPRFGVQNAKQS